MGVEEVVHFWQDSGRARVVERACYEVVLDVDEDQGCLFVELGGELGWFAVSWVGLSGVWIVSSSRFAFSFSSSSPLLDLDERNYAGGEGNARTGTQCARVKSAASAPSGVVTRIFAST